MLMLSVSFPLCSVVILISLLILMVLASLFFVGNNLTLIMCWQLPIIGGSDLNFPLILDKFSLLFGGSVLLITSAVLLFSKSYMKDEKFFIRFHLLVMLFVLSMLFLIFSPHLVFLLLGWDGLGVTSFLLVVYFQSSKSSNAGMLTVITNRLGDLMILLAIAMFVMEGNWELFFLSKMNENSLKYSMVVVLVSLAACTKSAQVPFSAWLPAAMAAPTPVSSLVHSSTLVTAGVYLLIRFQGVFNTNYSVTFFFISGMATMVMAGTSAMFEMDMKKIVALSTLSQLGLMVTSVSLGSWISTFVHLLSHAYFKALLFMSVGNMIHLSEDYQDIRKAALSSATKMSLAVSSVANLSLCGIPFTSGFFSKDWILEINSQSSSGVWPLILTFLATTLTASYTFRFISMIWWQSPRLSPMGFAQDQDFQMYSAFLILWPLAIMGGSGLFWSMNIELDLPVLSFTVKNLTLVIVLSGALLGTIYSMKSTFSEPQLLQSWGMMWALPFMNGGMKSFPLLISSFLQKIDLSLHPKITWISLMSENSTSSVQLGKSPKYSQIVWLSVILILTLATVYLVG